MTEATAKAGFTLPQIPTKLSCPQGDIFDFPTPAELANELSKIGQIPSKLEAYMAEFVDEIQEEAKEEIQDVIDTVEEFKEEIQKLLSPYWPDTPEAIEALKRYHVLMARLEEINEEMAARDIEYEAYIALDEERDKILEEIDELKSKFGIRDWQAEARQAITELIQEMHLYIPTKIAEIISKIVAIDFNITIMGIDINVPKILTKEEQKRIKLQICEKAEDLFENFMPEAYKTFDGTFGVDDKEKRCQAMWSYIKSEIHDWVTNALFKVFEKLIDLFDEIWEALGLPNLIAIFTFDVEAWIEGAIAELRRKIKEKQEEIKTLFENAKQARKEAEERMKRYRALLKRRKEIDIEMAKKDIELETYLALQEERDKIDEELGLIRLEGVSIKVELAEWAEDAYREALDELNALREEVCVTLGELSLLGFNVLDLLGGKIDTTVATCDDVIQAYIEAFRDLKINWKKKLLFEWVKIVKKFFDAIGLGKIFEFITITFCDILEMIGFPFDVPGNIGDKMAALAGAGLISIDDTQKFSGATVVKSKSGITDFLQIKDEVTGELRPVDQQELDKIIEKSANTVTSTYTGDGETEKFAIPPGKGKLRVFVDGKKVQEGGGGLAGLLASYLISGNFIRFLEAPKEGAIISLIKI